ncbi:MAG TPA: hypothetical protein VGI78_10985 [Acetobacteraceae bacterium]
MRIVLDTNVALSALLWRGMPYQLLLMELGEVLARPVFSRRLALIDRAPHEVLADYIDAVELVTPLTVPRVVADDPGSHKNFRIVAPIEAMRLTGAA